MAVVSDWAPDFHFHTPGTCTSGVDQNKTITRILKKNNEDVKKNNFFLTILTSLVLLLPSVVSFTQTHTHTCARTDHVSQTFTGLI